MSYDITFWKESRPLDLSRNEVYGRLSNGKVVDGLDKLPVEEVFAGLREAFGPFDKELSEFETDDCSIEVSWSKCHFRFDLRGDVEEAGEQIAALMSRFGCSLYDPQTDTREEAEDDSDSTPPLPKAVTDLMASRTEPAADGASGERITFIIERPDDDMPTTICQGPSDSDIESVVKSLPWDDYHSLQLWRDDSQYFDVCGSMKPSIPDNKLRARYQDRDGLFVTKTVLKSVDEVTKLLTSYNRGDDQWRQAVKWKVL